MAWLSFAFYRFPALAQRNETDSLLQLLNNVPRDSVRVIMLNRLSVLYRVSDNDKALSYAQQAMQVAEETDFKRGLANSLNNIAAVFRHQGHYEKAIETNLAAIKIFEGLYDKREITRTLNDIGTVYAEQGSYNNALSYYLKSLNLQETLNDTSTDGKRALAQSYNNIGIIYYSMNDYNKSLEYYSQALKIYEQLNNTRGVAFSYNNIGIIYHLQGDYAKALEYYQQSLKIREEIGDQRGIAASLNNLGDFYLAQNNYNQAIGFYLKSLKIKEQLGDKKGMALSLNNIGQMYLQQGNSEKALAYSSKSLEIAKEIGSKDDTKNAYETSAEIHAHMGQFNKAYELHKLYADIKDSIFNAENARQIAEMRTRYETVKKDKEIQLLNKDKEIQSTKLNRQKIINYSVTGGMCLVLALAFLVYNRYRLKQKANQALEAAYKEIADKNKDITDSIQYAKKIQEAILPAQHKIKEIFPQSFILYKPRDIVSGDFYWFTQKQPNGSNLQQKSSSQVVVAVADCTGHGVPGAFMSMIGNTTLNQIVNEKGIVEPASILTQLNTTIRLALKQDEKLSESKDGMDVAICSVDMSTNEMQFAGAYRPLYIFRDHTLNEIKGDKFPVGGFHVLENRRFTNHKVQLQKGDVLYVFSDGYADQFGGNTNRKFMTKRFKDLLLRIHHLPIYEQEAMLTNSYEEWKGDQRQMDDILVIGIRI